MNQIEMNKILEYCIWVNGIDGELYDKALQIKPMHEWIEEAWKGGEFHVDLDDPYQCDLIIEYYQSKGTWHCVLADNVHLLQKGLTKFQHAIVKRFRNDMGKL